MSQLRIVLTALLLLLSAAAPARSLPKDYTGPDAGYVIYSVGTVRLGMDFTFNYHRASLPDGASTDDWKSKIEPYLGGAFTLKIKNPDFSGDESGHVIVRRLPPGSYVVDGFFFAGWTPGTSYSWSSGVPFALPFKIEPNRATYIGSFMRSPSLGTPLAAQLGAAGFFIIADRSGRDLPIAHTKTASLPPVTVEVTKVDKFGNPALRTSAPN